MGDLFAGDWIALSPPFRTDARLDCPYSRGDADSRTTSVILGRLLLLFGGLCRRRNLGGG